MPLELVTGPANAEKAGHVLAAVRVAADAGRAPILVVPNIADADAFRRELAGDAVALGIAVERFGGLLAELARRAGVGERPLSAVAAERVARAAADGLADRGVLQELAPAARTPGFAPALARLCAEFGTARRDPDTVARALAIWGRRSGRAGFAHDVAALYGEYARRRDALGRPDEPGHAWRVLDALRAAPRLWGGTPVFLYGFDDLTAIQLDAVRTLADHVGAPVTVSLPFEPRTAFAGRQRTRAMLAELAQTTGGSVVELAASRAHYRPESADALHAIERGLFEADAVSGAPGEAVELLAGGGPRAELELVAERIRRLADEGTPLDQIAVAMRDVRRAAPLVESVFAEAGVPLALERWVPVGQTTLGRGLLALLRAALLGGGLRDLLVWLRTPGVLRVGALADRLEARARRDGVRALEPALVLWAELGGFPLDAIERLRAADDHGPVRLYEALAREAPRLLAAPHRSGGAGSAPLLGADAAADARAVGRIVATLEDLRRIGRADRRLAPAAAELHDLLATVEAPVGAPPRAGAVTVADPLALRARRVRALFLCRLQEGVFPKPGDGEPFLGDAERREIDVLLAERELAPLALGRHEDRLDGERYLLYNAVSRPTDLLVLSWHRADEDGEPIVRSPFVDDVLDVLAPAPVPRDRRLGAVRWDPDADLGPHQRTLDAAAAEGERRGRTASATPGGEPLSSRAVLDVLGARPAWSATELETYASCPVRWFVERLLRPGAIEPDAEPLGRGAVAHTALERTFRELAAEGRTLDATSLEHAIARMRVHVAAAEAERPISPDERRRLAERGRLEADLARYLRHASGAGSAFTPQDFEVEFGLGDGPEAVDIGGIAIRGRIDRVDRDPRTGAAIIVDYKGRRPQKPSGTWLEDGLLQAALYARAYEQLAQPARVVGALYQPLGAEPDKMAARGFLLTGADATRGDVPQVDRISEDERTALLDAVAQRACEVVADIRSGRLEPRPDRCGWDGSGCAHPSICRCAT